MDIQAIETLTVKVDATSDSLRYSLVGEWPQVTAFALRLLDGGGPHADLLSREGDMITVTLTDETATYRVVEEEPWADRVICERVP